MTERIKRGTPSLREVTFLADGEPADDGDVSVVVVGSDGSEVFSGAAGHPGVGRYTYPLSAQSDLDRLTETWTGDSIVHEVDVEIVGGFHFTTEEARALDPSFVEATYPLDSIVEVRQAVEDAIEGICGRAFVRRFHSEVLDGDGSCDLWLAHLFPRRILRLSVAGSALSGPELDALVLDSSGEVSRLAGRFVSGRGNVAVAYEYGEDSPPAIIKRAALLLFKAWLPAFHAADSGPSFDGARSVRLDGVGITYGETKGVSTGNDAVDRLITTWRGSCPVIA